MAYSNVEGGCGLVGRRIGDEDDFELVGKGEEAVWSSFGRRKDEGRRAG
jgi:hypothetical protein